MREDQKAAVQRMLQYMDDHLCEPITLYQLAQAAWYSPWHSARMFKEATGMAPFSYLRHRRLSEAARHLNRDEVKIVDVAFDFVFASHEGFSRAFSRQFGMNPQDFRRVWKRYRADRTSRRHTTLATEKAKECTMETVFVQVVDRPERKVVVRYAQKATDYFTYCEEVGCDVWDVLSGIDNALYEPMGMWMPQSLRKMGTGSYLQGVEVPLEFDRKAPEGYEVITLPACQMMIFQGPPFDEALFEEAIADLWEVMNRYDPTLYGFTWADEDGPRFQLAPMGYRGYIEGRPVRPMN